MVSWPGYSGDICTTRGDVANISTAGVSIRLQEPVAVGQVVRVHLGETRFQANVRSCQKSQDGFVVGLRLMEQTADEQVRKRWSWLFAHSLGRRS